MYTELGNVNNNTKCKFILRFCIHVSFSLPFGAVIYNFLHVAIYSDYLNLLKCKTVNTAQRLNSFLCPQFC